MTRPEFSNKSMRRILDASRLKMVRSQIRARGIKDKRLLKAMEKIPRHVFVPEEVTSLAYADEPLSIGYGQTISQPYIVAYMTEALGLKGGEKVLEVGSGSGYQTAILAELAAEVYTIERVGDLSRRAQATLGTLGYANIRFRVGDGTEGWPEWAPYDAIMVTAVSSQVPRTLQGQLASTGKMIIPVGDEFQYLMLVTREGETFHRETLIGVRFVPLKHGFED